MGAPFDVDFTCLGVEADRFAAGPTVVFRMRVEEHSGVRVHALALRCQVRIEPLRRHYSAEEGAAVVDLFGDRSRWGQTMKPLQLAFLAETLPGFTGQRDFELRMPCSYDVEVAAHKYLAALEDGEVPLLLLFSGTVFTGTVGAPVVGTRGGPVGGTGSALQVLPVPWHKETAVRMPVAVWRAAMDAHFPGQAWLRLARPTYQRLAAYRSRHGLVGWDEAVDRLLREVGE